MIKSVPFLVISAVLGLAVLGCGSLRKPAAVKTALNDYPAEKKARAAGDQESADSVANLLSSLNGPLILVDGIEVSVHLLADLNEDDIEEFSIYKDADAIKVYGIRGTEGVVVIKSNLSKRELRKRIKEDRRKRKIK